MTRRGWVLLLAGAALLAAIFVGVREVMRADRGVVSVAALAPSFDAITLDTPPEPRTLEDYRGEVVLLNIWATWCAPCRWEMPSMQALHEDFGDRGLRIVAVSIDHPAAGDVIRDFATQFGLTFEILHDTAGAISAQYHTRGVPETAVIDREGRVRRRVAGAEDWNSPANRALVERLINEQPQRRSWFRGG